MKLNFYVCQREPKILADGNRDWSYCDNIYAIDENGNFYTRNELGDWNPSTEQEIEVYKLDKKPVDLKKFIKPGEMCKVRRFIRTKPVIEYRYYSGDIEQDLSFVETGYTKLDERNSISIIKQLPNGAFLAIKEEELLFGGPFICVVSNRYVEDGNYKLGEPTMTVGPRIVNVLAKEFNTQIKEK